MPRRKFNVKDPPDDDKRLQDLIENSAHATSSDVLHAILPRPILRDALRISPQPKSKYQLDKIAQKIAAACHRRGYKAEMACEHCKNGGGPYNICVLFDGQLLGGCTNCYHSRDKRSRSLKCSHATDERQAAAQAVQVKKTRSTTATGQKTNRSTLEKSQSGAKSNDELTFGPPTFQYNLIHPLASSTQTFCIMGELILPDPRLCGLDSKFAERFREISGHISRLNARDLRKLPDRISNLEQEFEKFSKQEILLWEDSSKSLENESSLVRPSGSLDSPISHHLNQPSFTTSAFGSTETADESNGCIQMIMGNAFRKNHTLIFDHLHRRSAKCEGLKDYPEQVLHAHETFTRRIMASSASKVDIVYGKKIQLRMIESYKIDILPLWGRFEGIFLGLVPESCFHNQERDYRYRKIILFAAHPHHIFYQKDGNTTLLRQDLVIEVAILMADPTMRFNHSYYQSGAFRVNQPSIYERAKQKILKTDILGSVQDPIYNSDEDETDDKFETGTQLSWEDYFKSNPHSNDIIRKLLPDALRSIRETSDDSHWTHPSQFPTEVMKWYEGQKQVIFYYNTVHGIDDARVAFEKCVGLSAPHSQRKRKLSPGLKDMLYHIMRKQEEALKSIKGEKQHLLHNRFDGIRVKIACPCKGYTKMDEHPRYSCGRPGSYILRWSRGCRSMSCNPQRGVQLMKPTLEDLPWTYDSPLSLVAQKPLNALGSSYKACLQQQTDDSNLATEVELWCIRCKERSKFTEHTGLYVDKSPRWTLGHSRPLYVERQVTCLRCADRRQGRSSRVVPKDETIPCISSSALARFQQHFGHFQDVIKTKLLDSWPASSREPRYNENTTDNDQSMEDEIDVDLD